jgi:hypothetical protein
MKLMQCTIAGSCESGTIRQEFFNLFETPAPYPVSVFVAVWREARKAAQMQALSRSVHLTWIGSGPAARRPPNVIRYRRRA